MGMSSIYTMHGFIGVCVNSLACMHTEQGLPEDALQVQKPVTTALKHGLICILTHSRSQVAWLPCMHEWTVQSIVTYYTNI